MDLLEDGEGAVDGVALLPAGFGHFLAGVVEAVLGAWRAVQVDDDFDTDLSCPVDTLLKELCCSLCIGSVGVVERPESDRDSDHVEAAVSDLLEILELDPVLPVGSEDIFECCFGTE